MFLIKILVCLMPFGVTYCLDSINFLNSKPVSGEICLDSPVYCLAMLGATIAIAVGLFSTNLKESC